MRLHRITCQALALALATLGPLAVPAAAQYGVSQIVDPNTALAESMKTLAREPKNLDALIAAGRASLELGDMQSAAGFFGRADEAYPSSPLPKMGMGAALTMSGDPRTALTYFDRAQSLGAPASTIALDRGLAYDLLGQQAQAQAQYKMAMIGTQADEARRRLALSQAISRDIKGAAATIQPLLNRRDPAALKVNAFILALAGDREGARRTIDAAMPGAGARFEPFFRVLPILRPEEKAAAVHLGEFPKDAAQRYAQAQPVPLSPVTTIGNSRDGEIAVASNSRQQRRTGKATTQRQSERQAATKPTAKSRPVRVAQAPVRAKREVHVPNTYLAEVRESLNRDYGASETLFGGRKDEKDDVPAKPQPIVSQPSTSANPRDELSPLPSEREPLQVINTAPVNGDGEPIVTASANVPPPPTPKLEIERPPAPKPKYEIASRAPAKTTVEKGPDIGARGTYWVQLAGSGNSAYMGSEYKKIRAKSPSLFKGKDGFVTKGKDYFRLLVGPFDNPAEAQAFVSRLDKAGIDSFAWTRNPPQLRIDKISL